MSLRDKIFAEIEAEREHQDTKFGEFNNSALVCATILSEEVGEVHRAILETRSSKDANTYLLHRQNFRTEVLQVASVAMAILEQFDSNPMQFMDDERNYLDD